MSGYSTPIRQNVNEGTGACEGEQWDGQDSTGSEYEGDGVVYLDFTSEDGRIDRVGAYYHSTPDPGKPNINDNGPGDAVQFRVMGQGSPGWKDEEYNIGDGTLYAMVSVWGVATTGASARGHQDLMPCLANGMTLCSPTMGAGDDGALVGTAEIAWYGEDNTDQSVGALALTSTFDAAYSYLAQNAHPTPHNHEGGTDGNVLASVIHFPHVTIGQGVGEEDPACSQDDYVGHSCVRDNTAATVELLA